MINGMLIGTAIGWCGAGIEAAENDSDRHLAVILAVDKKGVGNERAVSAVRHLENADSRVLLDILQAMDKANDLGRNWLLAAADTIVDREVAQNRPLPLLELGQYLLDTDHHPRARRFVYEVLSRQAPEVDFLSGMLNDPSMELRRAAVQRLIADAARLETERVASETAQVRSVAKLFRERQAKELYLQALAAARDVDQIEELTDALRKHGETVDIPQKFGFLMQWKVIGPFDNSDRSGFARVFPPESELDYAASYPGKNDSVRWQDYVSDDEYGMLDINRIFGPLKEVTAYACAEFESREAAEIELRLGCKNAWKVWLNGELLFGRDEYHRGMRIDQYRMKGRLKPGKNVILVKVCQNEQMENWTVEWQFQLRVCDENGTAVLSENREIDRETERGAI